MLTSGDWAQMVLDASVIRDDNAGTVTLRRGTAALAAQTARVVLNTGGSWLDSGQAREARGGVYVMGGTALDVAVDDRFNYGGRLYRVRFVHPNRRARTVAEADVVE